MSYISQKDFMEIWEKQKGDNHIEQFPPGWKEHVLIFFEDFAETLALDYKEAEHMFKAAFFIFSQWEDGYPDPTLLSYLLHLRKYRPTCFELYVDNFEIPVKTEDWIINKKTFHLTREVNLALTCSPNPMRMREHLMDFSDMVDAFVVEHHCRFILPFDGRSTEQIYQMTGHIEQIVTSLKR